MLVPLGYQSSKHLDCKNTRRRPNCKLQQGLHQPASQKRPLLWALYGMTRKPRLRCSCYLRWSVVVFACLYEHSILAGKKRINLDISISETNLFNEKETLTHRIFAVQPVAFWEETIAFLTGANSVCKSNRHRLLERVKLTKFCWQETLNPYLLASETPIESQTWKVSNAWPGSRANGHKDTTNQLNQQ